MPEVGGDEVLIRIQKTSICGTDVHIYNWDAWSQKTIPVPMVIGHEFVGVVDRVGSSRERFCRGRSRHRRRPHHLRTLPQLSRRPPSSLPEHARRRRESSRRVSPNMSPIPMINVWHADPNIPLDVISCFDPLGNAVHTALSFDLVGEDVLITGAGPIGCMAVPICEHAGARNVVITDINPYRLDLARKMGATLALDVRTKTCPTR